MRNVYCRGISRLLCIAFILTLLTGCSAASKESQKQGMHLDGSLEAAAVDAENVQYIKARLLQPRYADVMGHISAGAEFCGDRYWVLGNGIGEKSAERILAGTSPGDSDTVFITLTPPPADDELITAPPEGERIGVSYQLISSSGALPGLLRTVIHLEDTDESFHVLYEEFYLSSVEPDGTVTEGVRIEAELSRGELLAYHCSTNGHVWMTTDFLGDAAQTRRLLGFSKEDGSLRHTLELPGGYTVNAVRAVGDTALQVTGYQMEAADGGIRSVSGSDRGWVLEIGENLVVTDTFDPCVNGIYAIPSFDTAGTDPQRVWGYTAEGLYVMDLRENRYTLFCRWHDSGMAEGLPGKVFILPDDRILTYQRNSTTGEPEFWLLDENSSMNLQAGNVITVGYMLSGTAAAKLKEQVRLFNAADTDVQVELIGYGSQTAAQAENADGAELLKREFALGSAPDVLVLSGDIDTAVFSSKGGLLDLYPFLEADDEISTDDFIAGIIKATETEGALPVLIPSYMLLTAAGSADRLGMQTGWNWEEYERLTAAVPAPFYGAPGISVLQHQVFTDSDRFIDRITGTAHFESDAFLKLLRAGTGYQNDQEQYYQQDPKPLFASGERTAMIYYLNEFTDMRTLGYTFDGAVVFKGFPSDTARNGNSIYPTLQVAITNNCDDPNEAWRFARQFVLPEWQNALAAAEGFPLRKDALEKLALKAQEPSEEYSCPAYLNWEAMTDSQREYWYRGLTKQECRQIIELIEGTTALYRYDDTIANILAEEAAGYYAGARPAEETAKLIQNRVQTYLAEQG